MMPTGKRLTWREKQAMLMQAHAKMKAERDAALARAQRSESNAQTAAYNFDRLSAEYDVMQKRAEAAEAKLAEVHRIIEEMAAGAALQQ